MNIAAAAAVLLVATIGIWLIAQGMTDNAGGNYTGPKPPQVERTNLSSRVNELLDDAYETVDEFPEQGSSWGFLGQALYANGFRDEGAECFEQARKLDDENCRWYYFLGLYHESTDSKKAEELILAAIERAEYPDVIRMHLAEMLYEEERYDECLNLVRDLRTTMGDYARLDLLEARMFLLQNELERARILAERAVEEEPEHAETHALLSQIYFRIDETELAERAAELGTVQSRPWPDYYVDAMMDLRRDTNWRVFLMETSTASIEDRIEVMREAVDEEPHVPGWHGRLATYLLEAGRHDEALMAANAGIDLHADSAELYYTRGLIQFYTEDFENSANSFAKATELKPDYAIAYTNLGMALRELNQMDRALDAFREAIRYQPDEFIASYNLAYTLWKSGDSEAAIIEYEAILESEPEVAEPYVNAAEILLVQGNAEKAKEYLQKALQLDPVHERAQELMAQFR